MICRKCQAVIPDSSIYCSMCGTKQVSTERKQRPKQRGNGTGTAYKRGNKWACRYRHWYEGRYVDIYKGGFETKRAALEYLGTINALNRTPSDISFEQLYSKWIQRHSERVSKSTIDCYKAAFKYFGKIHMLPFAKLTTEQLQVCIDECPHGVRTKENMKALCTSLYAYAHEIGVTAEDYGKHIYIDRKMEQSNNTTGKRFFTQRELDVLFDACNSGVEVADIILILCYTGFRINELLKLRKDSYNPMGRYLVGGGKTKAGTNRVVTISPKILPLLEARYNKAPNSNSLLFTKNGARITADNYRTLQKKCLSSLGLRELTPHECRHTFATLMKSVDGDKEDKMRLIGHSNEKMLLHYTHAELEDLRRITDKI